MLETQVRRCKTENKGTSSLSRHKGHRHPKRSHLPTWGVQLCPRFVPAIHPMLWTHGTCLEYTSSLQSCFWAKHCYLCPQLCQGDFFLLFFIAELERHNSCCTQPNFKYVEQWDFSQFPCEDLLQPHRSIWVGTSFLSPACLGSHHLWNSAQTFSSREWLFPG